MSGTVIILGAKGRFGRAAVAAFLAAGWQVKAFARSWGDQGLVKGAEKLTGDAFDGSAVTRAAQGCDVIVNALNPLYPRWTQELPRLTQAVLQAARETGATVMIPGNVYNYGAEMPALLTEDTPEQPSTRKGRLRVEMEQTYAAAAKEGIQTLILRGGDYIEREKTGGWFDSQITTKLAQGSVMYPGPLDQVHAWAYLPDMARALVGLAEKRKSLKSFDTFGFEGFSLTGQQLVTAIEKQQGRSLKVKSAPWPMMRLLGLVVPLLREVVEMRYLWQTPHAVNGSKLARLLPEFQATPLSAALAQALGEAVGQQKPTTDSRQMPQAQAVRS